MTGTIPPSSAPGGLVKSVVELDRVVIRLAGDSGDGMQLTGNRFTSETASFGNDLSTLPNFPAEIRAPTGTLPGVSSFQLHFADHDIMTPGDAPDVLVVMNPAALKANLADLPGGGLLIADADEFSPRNLAKVGYATNPLEDGSLEGWQLVSVPLTSMTTDALKDSGLGKKEAERSKNMFTLGLLSWMYHRPTEGTVRFLERQFRRKPEIAAANIAAFRAGFNYGETTEAFAVSYEVKPAPMAPGRYRNISGNKALALGLVAAGQRSGLPLFLGAYPITPASDILHELSKHKRSACARSRPRTRSPASARPSAPRSAARSGVTTTSGPGISLKSEAIGLAVMTRAAAGHRRRAARRAVHRPADQDRAGRPAAGDVRPQRRGAGAGRSRRGPPATASTPRSRPCRIALTYRTPVILLSDGYLANGAEPWADPGRRRPARPAGGVRDRAQRQPTARASSSPTCATRRRWPGRGRSRARPGLQHRIGGLEKADRHRQHLLRPGQPRLHDPHPPGQDRRHRRGLPPTEVDDPDGDATVAVIGWGSTYGPIGAACRRVRGSGPLDRADPPAPPQPDAGRPGRHPGPLRPGGLPGDEPRPAVDAAARQVPHRRREPHPGARAALPGRRAGRGDPGRHRPGRHPGASPRTENSSDRSRTRHADRRPDRRRDRALGGVARPEADRAQGQGLQDRPGGALVPRVR